MKHNRCMVLQYMYCVTSPQCVPSFRVNFGGKSYSTALSQEISGRKLLAYDCDHCNALDCICLGLARGSLVFILLSNPLYNIL